MTIFQSKMDFLSANSRFTVQKDGTNNEGNLYFLISMFQKKYRKFFSNEYSRWHFTVPFESELFGSVNDVRFEFRTLSGPVDHVEMVQRHCVRRYRRNRRDPDDRYVFNSLTIL
jgi:hypothetical protein